MSLLNNRHFNTFVHGSRQQFEPDSRRRMFVLRLCADLALCFAFLVIPWWLTLAAACAFMGAFRRFWIELIGIGLLYDVLYGAPAVYHVVAFQTTAVAALLAAMVWFIQSRTRI